MISTAGDIPLLTIGAAALMAVPILAHHSGAMFEKEKTVTVEGVVKEFQYTNPHSWLLVDVKNKNGTVTTWGFEGEGPSTLQRSGICPSDFKAGHQAENHRTPDEGWHSRGRLGRGDQIRWQALRPAGGIPGEVKRVFR